MIKKIEAKYPGQGVAKFVYECWAELKLFNASGGTSPVSPTFMRVGLVSAARRCSDAVTVGRCVAEHPVAHSREERAEGGEPRQPHLGAVDPSG